MNELMKNSLCACLTVSELIDVVQGYELKLFCKLLRLRVSTCLCWVFIDEWRHISFRLSSLGPWKSCCLSPLPGSSLVIEFLLHCWVVPQYVVYITLCGIYFILNKDTC